MVDVAQALGRDPAVIGKHAAHIGCRFNDPARPVRGPKTRRANRIPVTLQSLLALYPSAAVDVDLARRLTLFQQGGHDVVARSPRPPVA
jgi:hypothetical protein